MDMTKRKSNLLGRPDMAKAESNILTATELKMLRELGTSITMDLGCIAGNDMPCRTCRLEAVELMKKYIKIHGYKIK